MRSGLVFKPPISLLGSDRMRLLRRVNELETEQQFERLQIAMLQSQAAAYNKSSAVIVWDPKTKTGFVQFENMPAAGPGKDYQLWVVAPANPAPVSAGILPIGNDQRAKKRCPESVPKIRARGVSLECSRAGQKGAAGVRLATITPTAILLSREE